MRKLRFKVIVYEYIENKINKKIFNYENCYNDDMKLGDIVDDICEKFDKNSEFHRPLIMGINKLLWNRYFEKVNSAFNLIDERRSSDYFKFKIGELCSQFGIDNNEIIISINPPIGGDVGIHRGIHFFFHTNEKDRHHIPHIHVKNGNTTFRIGLEKINILDDKTFKNPKMTKIALKMVELNRKELIDYWNRVVIKGESIKFKMYFPYK